MEGKKWGRPGNEANDRNIAVKYPSDVSNLSVITAPLVSYPVHKTSTKKPGKRLQYNVPQ